MKTNRNRMIFFYAALTILVAWLAIRWLNARASPAAPLGIVDGRLAPCPDRPNCVSTYANQVEQAIPPISFEKATGDEISRLENIVRRMPRSRIVTSNDRYLHVEFRSRAFGFVDDVEFLVDPEARVIHMRSASRVGYSDLGVNRQRLEEIRSHFSGT